jgi:hypothetical protein
VNLKSKLKVISGGFGSIVGNPADLIKVRMQADAKLPEGNHFNLI